MSVVSYLPGEHQDTCRTIPSGPLLQLLAIQVREPSLVIRLTKTGGILAFRTVKEDVYLEGGDPLHVKCMDEKKN